MIEYPTLLHLFPIEVNKGREMHLHRDQLLDYAKLVSG
jgi:hypothetical protein